MFGNWLRVVDPSVAARCPAERLTRWTGALEELLCRLLNDEAALDDLGIGFNSGSFQFIRTAVVVVDLAAVRPAILLRDSNNARCANFIQLSPKAADEHLVTEVAHTFAEGLLEQGESMNSGVG